MPRKGSDMSVATSREMRLSLLMIGLMSAVIAPVAHASSPSLLDVLHSNNVITSDQYKVLQKYRKAGEKEGPNLYGYGQLDFPVSVSGSNTIGDSTLLRRLYVGAKGGVGNAWKYKVELGFISGKAGVSTAELSYIGFRPIAITVGYMKMPFGLDYMTSPQHLAFTERALPIALVPGKKIGVEMSSHGSRWNLAGGVFGGKYNATPTTGKASNWGESVRGTYVPFLQGRTLWEVGASYGWRKADSTDTYKASMRPEAYVVGTKLVNTGTIKSVSSFSSGDLETAVVSGPWTAQAEYIRGDVDRYGDLSNLVFDGWYAQTTYTLTGEQRRFVPSKGTFAGIKPRNTVSAGGIGAWEIALRYSCLNLNSLNVSGGRERDVAVGVNWYPEKAVRFTLDYVDVVSVEQGKHDGLSPNIVEARAQISF